MPFVVAVSIEWTVRPTLSLSLSLSLSMCLKRWKVEWIFLLSVGNELIRYNPPEDYSSLFEQFASGAAYSSFGDPMGLNDGGQDDLDHLFGSNQLLLRDPDLDHQWRHHSLSTRCRWLFRWCHHEFAWPATSVLTVFVDDFMYNHLFPTRSMFSSLSRIRLIVTMAEALR